MALLILGIIVLIIIVFLAEAGLLLWLEKLFKIKKPTYKNALKILVFGGVVSGIIEIFFYIVDLGLISKILGAFLSFYAFHYFQKKYYACTWQKSLGIYILLAITGVIIAFTMILGTRVYIFSPFAVAGKSMSPTYNDGDYLLVNKFDKVFVRDDVIVYHTAKDPNDFMFKRIIGLPSEKIVLRSGQVYINDQILNETYTTDATEPDSSITLGSDQYFVLGDNRINSLDSRILGPIPKSNIEGKVFYNVSDLMK